MHICALCIRNAKVIRRGPQIPETGLMSGHVVLGTNPRSSVTVASALTTEHSLNTQLLGLPFLVESDQCFLPRNPFCGVSMKF